MSDPFVGNAFFVLGLTPDASALDVEREGQKLLGMLALEHAGVQAYATPYGTQTRTEEAVRRAVARLRDPDKRFVDEIWARAQTRPSPVVDSPSASVSEQALWWWGTKKAAL